MRISSLKKRSPPPRTELSRYFFLALGKKLKKLANTLRSICAIHLLMQLLTKFYSLQFASPHTLFRLLSYTASYFLT